MACVAFARDPKGRGFESLLVRHQVTALDNLLTRMYSVTMQYNLVTAWRKVMAAYSLPPGAWVA